MASIDIYFGLNGANPALGYKVFYRPTGTVTYVEYPEIFYSSPAKLLNLVALSQGYEGYIEAYCGFQDFWQSEVPEPPITTTTSTSTTSTSTSTTTSTSTSTSTSTTTTTSTSTSTTTSSTTTTTTLSPTILVIGTFDDDPPTYGFPLARLLVTSGPNFTNFGWQNVFFPNELQFGRPDPFPLINTASLARGGSRDIQILTGATYCCTVCKLEILVDDVLYTTFPMTGFYPSNTLFTSSFSNSIISTCSKIEYRFTQLYV